MDGRLANMRKLGRAENRRTGCSILKDKDKVVIEWPKIGVRPKKTGLSCGLAIASFWFMSTVGSVSADTAFADGDVKLDCFFAVRCEVGSADCELVSGTQTYVFDKAHMINVERKYVVHTSSDQGRASVLVILNSGESRLLQFRIPEDGRAQSIGHVLFGNCQPSD